VRWLKAASLFFSTAVTVSVCEPSVSSEAWDIGSVSSEQAVVADSAHPISIVLIYNFVVMMIVVVKD
jgi:hypothetical protein